MTNFLLAATLAAASIFALFDDGHAMAQDQADSGDPVDLLTGAEWVVEDIDEQGIPDGASITLAFLPDGRVAGSGGCNRYNASFTLSGDGLGFGPAAATMMACPEALMNIEQRFHATLAAVERFEIDDTGALVLIAPSGRILARR
jgi:heat shock protein HslJ